MDFVDWCSLMLNKIIEASKTSLEARHRGVDEKFLAQTIFGKDFVFQPNFMQTSQYRGMLDALRQLESNHLIERYKTLAWWKATNNGRKFAHDITSLWEEICQEELEADHQQLLQLINQLSPLPGEDHICLSYVTHETILSQLQWPDGMDRLWYVAQDLKQSGFIAIHETLGPHISIWATYRGLVWETRCGLTLETKFIEDLVAEWETPTVDFKQYLYIKTVEQKAEFIKDILSLVNAKASGRRWMIIGFNNKTHDYSGPPNTDLSQDNFERLLGEYTNPYVDVRYEVVEYKKGRVGKLEVLRDTQKLPYRVAKSLGDKLKGDKKQIIKGQIFVRHGSQVVVARGTERKELLEEGKRARSNPQA